jgi:hypothetical protein
LSEETEEEKEAAELRTLQHDAEERAATTKAKSKVNG